MSLSHYLETCAQNATAQATPLIARNGAKHIAFVPLDVNLGDLDAAGITAGFVLTDRFVSSSYEERTRQFTQVSDTWRKTGRFGLKVDGPDELIVVYDADTPLFAADRDLLFPLGLVRAGVILCAYSAGDEPRCWVGKRAANKDVYPGTLDNTAAGLLQDGESVEEGMKREANEEASLKVD